MEKIVSINTLKRLPSYLNFLEEEKEKGTIFISSSQIASHFGTNIEQVRKDIQVFSKEQGRPKIGRKTIDLINDLKEFLQYNDTSLAVIIGCGKLGSALLTYPGFKEYGLEVVAGFDIKADLIGTEVNGKPIFPMEKLKNLVSRMHIHIGIITSPNEASQSICDLLVSSGIKAIWNFTQTHLVVQKGIIVQNESLADSLALLSRKLKTKIEGKD